MNLKCAKPDLILNLCDVPCVYMVNYIGHKGGKDPFISYLDPWFSTCIRWKVLQQSPKLSFSYVWTIDNITQVTLSNTPSVNQRFTIAGRPEARYVTITVTDVFMTTNNGFSDVHFLGVKGMFANYFLCNSTTANPKKNRKYTEVRS